MSENVKRGAAKKAVASEHFKRFATDTFGLRLNNNWAQVIFSMDTQDAEEQSCLVQEATAVMTLQSLKVLQILLTNSIAAAEAQFGPIALAPGKEEELRSKATLAFETTKG